MDGLQGVQDIIVQLRALPFFGISSGRNRFVWFPVAKRKNALKRAFSSFSDVKVVKRKSKRLAPYLVKASKLTAEADPCFGIPSLGLHHSRVSFIPLGGGKSQIFPP